MTILALPQQRTAHARRSGTPERRTQPAGYLGRAGRGRLGGRARWLAGTPVRALLKTIPAEHG